MPKTKVKTKSDIIRKEFRISPHIQQLIYELKEAGNFKSEAEVIKTAIIRMHLDYERQGKLKTVRSTDELPDEAKEILKKAQKEKPTAEWEEKYVEE